MKLDEYRGSGANKSLNGLCLGGCFCTDIKNASIFAKISTNVPNNEEGLRRLSPQALPPSR